jgi:hypothetical protein
VNGRTVHVVRSTVSDIHTDDVDVKQAAVWSIHSENDAIFNQSFVGKATGRIVKINHGVSFYTKGDIVEGNNWYSVITNAEHVQGTLKTLFTNRSAAIFAGILVGAYMLLRRRKH